MTLSCASSDGRRVVSKHNDEGSLHGRWIDIFGTYKVKETNIHFSQKAKAAKSFRRQGPWG